jgi:hypothetical protein
MKKLRRGRDLPGVLPGDALRVLVEEGSLAADGGTRQRGVGWIRVALRERADHTCGKCKRRGSPPLERSGSRVEGRSAAESAQAQRGRLGCLLSRAREGVPQQAWLPCISVKRRDCFGRCSSGGRCGQEQGA